MKFRYKARDLHGSLVKGELEASNKDVVAEALRRQRLMPITIDAKSEFNIAMLTNMFGRVSAQDVTNFTRQLSTMITAGLPITDALNLLRSQSSPAFSVIVGKVLADVQAGVSLSDALAKHNHVFSEVYVALVKAGESAGVMETILNRLADNMEKSREFKGKVVGAMIYPIIILLGMVGVTIIMVTVVVPKLTSLYQDFGADLPWPTKVLILMSNITIHYWWALTIVVVTLFIVIPQYFASKAGRAKWDGVMYKIPVLGPLSRQVALAELTRTLGLLMSAGEPVVEALNTVANAVGNVLLRDDIKRIAKQVEKGFPVSISFSESEVFPPLVGQMIAVGEETGKMDEVLAKLAHYFESESEEKIKGLTTAIEPIIIIVLAVGVGFLMYAVVMPLYSITNKF